MPYDDNFEYNTNNFLFNNDDSNDVGVETLSGLSSESSSEIENTLRDGDFSEYAADSDTDYSTYLESIIANQETIIANQETLIGYEHNISDNSFRLYYFIGGLYVAFAIVIMIKFFKTFLF